MDRRLAPQEAAQGITLLGDFAESVPRTARVFTWNHPDVTGDRLRVGESCRIAEEHFGRQRGDRADARVGHQTARLRTVARERVDALIQVRDLRRQTVGGVLFNVCTQFEMPNRSTPTLKASGCSVSAASTM